jgi:hypothetical protein
MTTSNCAASSGTRSLALAISLCFIGSPIAAADSEVQVHDGDTLTIDGQRWRLWGIDGPELDQTCFVDAHDTPCGVRPPMRCVGWFRVPLLAARKWVGAMTGPSVGV